MKKLIILFCGTLALAACGNGLEKKANEKLMVAKAAYERGQTPGHFAGARRRQPLQRW
jgi:hypothetical protein